MSIENLKKVDPFAEATDDSGVKTNNPVHIRIQQRAGKKSITTVQGLPEELDFKLVLKAFKKQFNCNGTVVEDEELGEVLQLSGDQRENIARFLIDEEICEKANIKVHGF
eukprot:tig00020723_g13423.t1